MKRILDLLLLSDAYDRKARLLVAFLAVLPEFERAMCATAAYAGLRLGELRALRWSDVALNDGDGPLGGWITVERAWDPVAGVIEPKSDGSRRMVPVVRPYLTDLLAAHKASTGRDGDDLVFGKTATAVMPNPSHRLRPARPPGRSSSPT